MRVSQPVTTQLWLQTTLGSRFQSVTLGMLPLGHQGFRYAAFVSCELHCWVFKSFLMDDSPGPISSWGTCRSRISRRRSLRAHIHCNRYLKSKQCDSKLSNVGISRAPQQESHFQSWILNPGEVRSFEFCYLISINFSDFTVSHSHTCESCTFTCTFAMWFLSIYLTLWNLHKSLTRFKQGNCIHWDRKHSNHWRQCINMHRYTSCVYKMKPSSAKSPGLQQVAGSRCTKQQHAPRLQHSQRRTPFCRHFKCWTLWLVQLCHSTLEEASTEAAVQSNKKLKNSGHKKRSLDALS